MGGFQRVSTMIMVSASVLAAVAMPLVSPAQTSVAGTAVPAHGGTAPESPAAQTAAGDGNASATAGAATVDPTDAWFEKGLLLSVYGNYKAAVQAFRKVLEAAPDRSAAHFQMGVAYGEMGNTAEALAAIDKAIALDPGRGAYYYGRGRVYLMAGDREKAMADFGEAARMGNRDAKRYLKHR
jgi:tetratricopeptide (TPR) repeat protein